MVKNITLTDFLNRYKRAKEKGEYIAYIRCTTQEQIDMLCYALDYQGSKITHPIGNEWNRRINFSYLLVNPLLNSQNEQMVAKETYFSNKCDICPGIDSSSYKYGENRCKIYEFDEIDLGLTEEIINQQKLKKEKLLTATPKIKEMVQYRNNDSNWIFSMLERTNSPLFEKVEEDKKTELTWQEICSKYNLWAYYYQVLQSVYNMPRMVAGDWFFRDEFINKAIKRVFSKLKNKNYNLTSGEACAFVKYLMGIGYYRLAQYILLTAFWFNCRRVDDIIYCPPSVYIENDRPNSSDLMLSIMNDYSLIRDYNARKACSCFDMFVKYSSADMLPLAILWNLKPCEEIEKAKAFQLDKIEEELKNFYTEFVFENPSSNDKCYMDAHPEVKTKKDSYTQVINEIEKRLRDRDYHLGVFNEAWESRVKRDITIISPEERCKTLIEKIIETNNYIKEQRQKDGWWTPSGYICSELEKLTKEKEGIENYMAGEESLAKYSSQFKEYLDMKDDGPSIFD